MPTPRADTASIASGADLWAGRDAPTPAWMIAAVDEWAQISGTTAPTELKEYCGVAVRDDETGVHIYSAAAGGHSASSQNNRAMTINLDAASPAWSELFAGSDLTGTSLTDPVDAECVSDGHPVARHTYQGVNWVPELSRVMVGGEAGGSDGTGSFADHYGLDVAAPDWDAAGTWPDRSDYRANPAVRNPLTGKWLAFYNSGTGNRAFEYDPTQEPPTWTARTLTGGTDYSAKRGAYAWDSTRENFFHLAGGGWFTQAAGWSAQQIDPATYARTDISFNSSAAFTDFTTNSGKFVGSALTYSEADDAFYFYNGNTGSPALTGQGAKVYKIIPNGSATWDMEIVSVTGVTPATDSGGGVITRFFFVPRWRCLILIVYGQSVYYLRTGTV